jgi:two-component system KDP operon response regulator KdpE
MNDDEERLLVVEDDPRMQRLLRTQLAARGFSVQAVGTGFEALAAFAGATPPHLVLLDIGLPGGMDGIETCRRMRAVSSVPIILVTAADDPRTKVTALELGADDYLTKPFHAEELAARIRAVLRRAGRVAATASGASLPTVIPVGELVIDLAQRQVRRNGEAVHLTKTEFDLLRELVTHPDQVLSYAYLLQAVWGGGEDVRPVHVHLSHLRRKIESGPTGPRRILAVSGVGYRFQFPHQDNQRPEP